MYHSTGKLDKVDTGTKQIEGAEISFHFAFFSKLKDQLTSNNESHLIRA